MKRLASIWFVVVAAAIAIGLVVIPERAEAQGSAALSIVPKKNYTIEPGKSVDDTLTVRNLDRQEPLHLTLRVIDFTFRDDGGAPELMLDENAPQTTWSLKLFLKVPNKVTIEPGTSQTLDMSVSIPENQGAGSFYSAIVYSTGSSEGGNVGLSASGVTLVFTRCPGEVHESLVLEKLGAYDSENRRFRYITSSKPKEIAYQLRNEGNVAEAPVGSITLKPLFGDPISIDDINPSGSLALIGQNRTFLSCIKLRSQEVDFNGSRTEATTCSEPELWPGYYSVELNAFYGQNGNMTKDLTGKASFWYLPAWFIIAVVVVLAFVGYHIWKIVRFFRRRKSSRRARASRSARK